MVKIHLRLLQYITRSTCLAKMDMNQYLNSFQLIGAQQATKHASCSLQIAGTYQGLRSGFALYGTEGTLHLDLDSKKLTLATKEEGVHLFVYLRNFSRGCSPTLERLP